MVKILNIHGFDGHAENTLYRKLCKEFGPEKIISPQFDYRSPPFSTYADIMDLAGAYIPTSQEKSDGDWIEHIPEHSIGLVVGNSLGGYWALIAMNLLPKNVKVMLFNPSLKPHITLQKYGLAKDALKYYEENPISNDSFLEELNLEVFIGDSDEVIDHTESIKRLQRLGKRVTIVPGVGHRFTEEDLEGILFSPT